VFKRGIGHCHNQFIRRLAVRLNYNGAIFAFGFIEQRAKSLELSFLIAKINPRDSAAGDADDLRISLGAEQERRGWRRNGDPRLEDKVRTQQQEKDEQKHDVD